MSISPQQYSLEDFEKLLNKPIEILWQYDERSVWISGKIESLEGYPNNIKFNLTNNTLQELKRRNISAEENVLIVKIAGIVHI